VIAFLEGNSKVGLPTSCRTGPYYQYQTSVSSSTRKWRRR